MMLRPVNKVWYPVPVFLILSIPADKRHGISEHTTDWSMRSGTQSEYSVYCLFQLIKDMVSVRDPTDWSMGLGT